MKMPPVNVGTAERLIAGVLCGVVLGNSLRRPSILGFLGAACLLYRATTGNCKGYQLFGVSTCRLDSRP